MWLFIQNQVLGMQWLNEVVVAILQYAGVDVQSRVGGSLQFFFYDVVKITVLLCVLIFLISYIQSYFPPDGAGKSWDGSAVSGRISWGLCWGR